MPSSSEHRRYCMEHGIEKEICDLANRLVDYPHKYVPKYLSDPKIRDFVSQRLGLSYEEIDKIVEQTKIVSKIMEGKICEDCSFSNACKFKDLKKKPKVFTFGGTAEFFFRMDPEFGLQIVMRRSRNLLKSDAFDLSTVGANITDALHYWAICPVHKEYPYAVTHSRIHVFSERNTFKDIIKEIANYYYGEKGVKAIDLHLELDEISHILNEIKRKIPAYLSRGIRGTIVNKAKKYSAVNFLRKYLYKDPFYLVRELTRINITNYMIFLSNLAQLLSMRVGDFLEYYNGQLRDYYIIEILTNNEDKFEQLIPFLKANINSLKKVMKNNNANELLNILKS